MPPERWREVERLYFLAREKPPGERTALLEKTCHGDTDLRREVESLLNHDTGTGEFLQAVGLEAVVPARDLPDLPAAGSPTATVESVDAGENFQSTARFIVQERLGQGSFGVVYRVFDKERNSQVALKKLLHFDPAGLLRFKHEFRSLVDLVHPNLVQFHELFGEDRRWFFTMELVPGVDFLSYAGGRWDRLRDTLFQLAAGIQALHSSGRLHRDLKPSNVLVTGNGRVVILDFGLVKEFGPRSIEDSFLLAGTPAYMAPEQAAGSAISESADWYAVGVMLFKALTGQLPFAGNLTEALERKQREPAPDSRDLAPGAPEDLHSACDFLLQRSPEKRAPGVALLLAKAQPNTSSPDSRHQEAFVGRRAELSSLRDRFGTLSSGGRQVVLIQGKSGMGKTSLLSHFLSELRRDHPNTVILRGQCRESESVPYKALDPIADELVRHLGSLPEPVAMALLPRHPELLRRLFPVFGQLEILPAVPDRALRDLDEQQIRRRAFEALSELLGRMSDRTPVVISIDDLQWGDLDSVAFLAELVLPVNAPALLLIFSFRSEDAESSPALQALTALQQQSKDAGSWADIEIKGLSDEEARDLLDVLKMKRAAMGDEQSSAIVRESGGSPLLLSELLRFAGSEPEGDEQGQQGDGVLLSDMIRRRAGALSSTARQLLEALSVAGEPVSRAILCRAVETADQDPAGEIALLIREHLVRVTGTQQAKLEPFHDQVREASLSWLSNAELRAWHARLAELLRVDTNMDPQRLLRHYRGAGNSPAAFEAALAAAANSENALAFEQAARFYAAALETGEAGKAAQANIHRKRAEALARAGRGSEAADEYRNAARFGEYNDIFQMQRLAAEQLMRSGYLDEGIQTYRGLLRSVGFWMPSTPLQSIAAMLAVRALIRLRGMRWQRQVETDLPALTVRNLDLLWTGALVLSGVNPVFGTYLQARHMLEALRAGEPFRLARSVGLGAGYESLGGASEYHRGRKLLDFSDRIASDLQDPYTSALLSTCGVVLDYLCGWIREGLEHSRASVQMLRELGTEVTWESNTANMLLIWFLGWGGRIREMSDLVPSILDEARSRGDVYSLVMIRVCAPAYLADLAADDPDRAIRETGRALAKWSQARYDFPHFAAAFARVECDLYAGRLEKARSRALTEWSAMRRSLLSRKCQTFRIMLFYMRGKTALAIWTRQRGDRTLVREIEHYSSRLTKSRSPWGAALGNALRGGLEAGRGRVREAILLLDRAEVALREQDFRLLAEAISRRRGELEGDAGADLVASADAFMRSENILRPDRITAMMLPGNWVANRTSETS